MSAPARYLLQDGNKFMDLKLRVSKRAERSIEKAITDARTWGKRVTITINGTEHEVVFK
jgi:hypothetical protein